MLTMYVLWNTAGADLEVGTGGVQSNSCLTENFIFRNFEFDKFLYRIYPDEYSLT